jgi:hypothetical protein
MIVRTQAEKRQQQSEAGRRWRAKNPEKAREARRRWYAQNREKIRETRRLKRAREDYRCQFTFPTKSELL